MIGTLKGLVSKLTANQDEQPAPRYPNDFIAVRWKEAGRKLGAGGRRNKKIVRVKNQRVTGGYSIPYHPKIVQRLRDELNLPVLDETGGQESPVHDKLLEYDPGVLAWNQDQLQGSKRR